LVTVAYGTVGAELVRQLLTEYDVAQLVGINNNESELFFLEQRLQNFKNARFFLADVRDGEKLLRMMPGFDIVFRTAALKHVILCERSPYEAVQTNILG
jgi:FlaA1/EpsC-like NDP-sugar epimerase